MVNWNLDSLGAFFNLIVLTGKRALSSVSITFHSYTFSIWHYLLGTALLSLLLTNFAPWLGRGRWGGKSD